MLLLKISRFYTRIFFIDFWTKTIEIHVSNRVVINASRNARNHNHNTKKIIIQL